MESAALFILAALVAGFVGGLVFSSHIHAIASNVSNAAARAVTVPSGALAHLPPGVASAITAQTDVLKDHITDTVAAAVAATQPKG